jgi:hypothetical protein
LGFFQIRAELAEDPGLLSKFLERRPGRIVGRRGDSSLEIRKSFLDPHRLIGKRRVPSLIVPVKITAQRRRDPDTAGDHDRPGI